MSVGKYTYHGDLILAWENPQAKYICGKFCAISNLKVYLGGNHNSNFITTYRFGSTHKDVFNNLEKNPGLLTNGDVIIGNDVWIGDHVTIMSGVNVGDGAIIAAYSHVVKNVEPYSVVGGNPAKLIRYRFRKDQIEKLLQIKWWDWEDVKINKHLNNLCCANIDNFISLHYENPGLSTNINDNSQDTYDIKKIDVENILVEKNVKISYIIDMQNDTEFTEKYKEKINTTVFDIGDINDYIHTILLQDCCIVSLSITINEKTSYALKNLYKTLQFYNYSGMICFKNINSLINTL